jgi:hypothetical protein
VAEAQQNPQVSQYWHTQNVAASRFPVPSVFHRLNAAFIVRSLRPVAKPPLVTPTPTPPAPLQPFRLACASLEAHLKSRLIAD